jgi:hypothetical protein
MPSKFYDIPVMFNDWLGKEDDIQEFKEFSLHNSGLTLTYSESAEYIKNYHFMFNSCVLANLERYIQIYGPKNACGFLNRNTKGILCFGVDNYGFVKGIPFQGELPIETIKKNIIDTIQRNIANNRNYKIDFNKLVSVKIIKIHPPDKPTLVVPKAFTDYINQKNAYEKAYNEFIEKIIKWKEEYSFFNQKLVDLVNGKKSRDMLIEYIIHNDPTNPVIDILESDYTLKYSDHEEINILKEDLTDPYYWVCKWKDEMCDMMNKKKPIFNDYEHPFYPATPYNLIISVREMIPYWMHNNPSMNLYLIIIKFNTITDIYKSLDLSDILFSYLPYNDKNWVSCCRTILPNGEPECTPC